MITYIHLTEKKPDPQIHKMIVAKTKPEFDRIIIFSDSQDCDTNKALPKPYGKYNYIVDVSSEKRGICYKGIWTAEVTGFSEHFLTFIAGYEGLANLFEE